MADQIPLVVINGQVQQLPVGDTISGVSIVGAAIYVEPVVVAGFNSSVAHASPEHSVPMFVTTLDGDIVVAEA